MTVFDIKIVCASEQDKDAILRVLENALEENEIEEAFDVKVDERSI